MPNKIKYGLKSVMYAKCTIAATGGMDSLVEDDM